jgi:hypothetical protein
MPADPLLSVPHDAAAPWADHHQAVALKDLHGRTRGLSADAVYAGDLGF